MRDLTLVSRNRRDLDELSRQFDHVEHVEHVNLLAPVSPARAWAKPLTSMRRFIRADLGALR
jgi:hypothetical protein